MGFDALFWHTGVHADRALIHKINNVIYKDVIFICSIYVCGTIRGQMRALDPVGL